MRGLVAQTVGPQITSPGFALISPTSPTVRCVLAVVGRGILLVTVEKRDLAWGGLLAVITQHHLGTEPRLMKR